MNGELFNERKESSNISASLSQSIDHHRCADEALLFKDRTLVSRDVNLGGNNQCTCPIGHHQVSIIIVLSYLLNDGFFNVPKSPV